ncbi:4-carboxymuconolactone decarboxylase /3-oxoadipate enol-lactonase [Nocardioides sp. YR527]|uniref:bifunctional 3-oxoadipate enol-lactonase/4-carboxymuconolactone decarboxylase PcaDC n=1 Tax=Nocardioides sp. YR527 TaxID=1881028 RepID=UPI000882B66E|nr:alpha/beta fold hydrolase [Nocardioides sp. YR527]SDK69460.1 4-carboxymuconolactone decarboxylase /3-oxoadipate enol-lactonase [Nocardioides sp. YR527]
MTPRITPVELAGDPSKPILVVGPSLGTSVTALWDATAELLADSFHVIGWELPGHGHGAPAGEVFSMADLAAGVLACVDRVLADRGERHGTFAYAGDSVGGAVGLQLLLDAPTRVSAAVLTNTGAKIGEPEGWNDRAATVRKAGTASQIAGSTQRWFAPGFLEREPARGGALLHSLRDADAESYALVCEALAAYDVRGRLAEIAAPVLAIAGVDDAPTPPASLEEIAVGVRNGRLVSLDAVGHLAPAEAPHAVSTLITSHVTASDPGYAAGMNVRRQVLGDDHVDRATAAITDVNRDYQDLITRYAWGTIWTRPGLARRDRSIGVLTALVAGRHFEELEFHLRAALTNGLTREEIIEVLLQTSIYVGVPAANTAFAVANRVLNE